MKSDGYKIVMQDESIFLYETRPRRGLWTKIGERPHIVTTGVRIRVAVHGALFEDGTQVYRTYDKFNSKTFVKHLEAMRSKWPKIFVIVDNASAHKSKIVKKYLEKHGGDVILHYLPPWSPQLNPVEESWRQSKREILDKHHESFSAFTDAITKYFKHHKFNLNIHNYLERII